MSQTNQKLQPCCSMRAQHLEWSFLQEGEQEMEGEDLSKFGKQRWEKAVKRRETEGNWITVKEGSFSRQSRSSGPTTCESVCLVTTNLSLLRAGVVKEVGDEKQNREAMKVQQKTCCWLILAQSKRKKTENSKDKKAKKMKEQKPKVSNYDHCESQSNAVCQFVFLVPFSLHLFSLSFFLLSFLFTAFVSFCSILLFTALFPFPLFHFQKNRLNQLKGRSHYFAVLISIALPQLILCQNDASNGFVWRALCATKQRNMRWILDSHQFRWIKVC